MKIQTLILLSSFTTCSFADVITCGDAFSVGSEAKASLHQSAQQRAQKSIEDFTGNILARPYIAAGGFEPVCGGNKCTMTGTPQSTAEFVEIFWCETKSTPLHSAYYRMYSSSKDFFDKRYLP